MISAKLSRKHAIKDLRPYICLAEQCPASEQLFRTWNTLESHNTLEHGDNPIIPSKDMQDGLETLTCPLCSRPSSSARFAARHLRQHMEQLALFALPPSYRGADDEDPESNDSKDGADSREAFSVSDTTSTPSPTLSVSGSTGDERGEFVMDSHIETDWTRLFQDLA
jgi:hypothetical protein